MATNSTMLMVTAPETMTTDIVPVPVIQCYAKKPYEGYYRMKSIMEDIVNGWLDMLFLYGPWYRDPEEPCVYAPSGRPYYYM